MLTRVQRRPPRLVPLLAAVLAVVLVAGCSGDDAAGDDDAAPVAETTTTTTTVPSSTFEPITGGTDDDGDPLPPPVHASVSIVVAGDTSWAPYAGRELTSLDEEAAAAIAIRIRQLDPVLSGHGVPASFELTYGTAAALCRTAPELFDELTEHGHEVSAHPTTKGETFRVVRALGECGIVPGTASGLPDVADPVGAAPTTVASLNDAFAVLSVQDLHRVVGPVRALCESLGLWAPSNNYGTGADTAPWRSGWRDGAPCEDAPNRPIVAVDQFPLAPDADELVGPESLAAARTRMVQTLGWAADLRYRSAEELPAPGMLTWGMTMHLDDLVAPPEDPDDGAADGGSSTTTVPGEEATTTVPIDPRTAPLGEETLTLLGEWFAEWQAQVDDGRLIWLTPREIAAILQPS